jgi:hypothetical protein
MNIFVPILKEIIVSTSEFEKNLLYYAQIGGEITCVNRLLLHLKNYGEIIGLDKWAHDQNLNPWWVRHCAHQAEARGLIKMVRLENKCGKPYQVTLQEETK